MTSKPHLPMFHRGGYVSAKLMSENLFPRGVEAVIGSCNFRQKPGAQAAFFEMDLLPPSVVFEQIKDAIIAEATARAITLTLIRRYGVTIPLRAARTLPRPMGQVDALILAKLEAVAEHLGAP